MHTDQQGTPPPDSNKNSSNRNKATTCVLILGGTCFMGRHLLDSLVRRHAADLDSSSSASVASPSCDNINNVTATASTSSSSNFTVTLLNRGNRYWDGCAGPEWNTASTSPSQQPESNNISWAYFDRESDSALDDLNAMFDASLISKNMNQDQVVMNEGGDDNGGHDPDKVPIPGLARAQNVVIIDFSCFDGGQAVLMLEALTGTQDFLEGRTARSELRSRLRKYVLISTDSVYTSSSANRIATQQKEGNDNLSFLISESHPMRSTNGTSYGAEKAAAEYAFTKMPRYAWIRPLLLVLRLPDVIGPRDDTGRYWATAMWARYSPSTLYIPRSLYTTDDSSSSSGSASNSSSSTVQNKAKNMVSYVYSCDVSDLIYHRVITPLLDLDPGLPPTEIENDVDVDRRSRNDETRTRTRTRERGHAEDGADGDALPTTKNEDQQQLLSVPLLSPATVAAVGIFNIAAPPMTLTELTQRIVSGANPHATVRPVPLRYYAHHRLHQMAMQRKRLNLARQGDGKQKKQKQQHEDNAGSATDSRSSSSSSDSSSSSSSSDSSDEDTCEFYPSVSCGPLDTSAAAQALGWSPTSHEVVFRETSAFFADDRLSISAVVESCSSMGMGASASSRSNNGNNLDGGDGEMGSHHADAESRVAPCPSRAAPPPGAVDRKQWKRARGKLPLHVKRLMDASLIDTPTTRHGSYHVDPQ